LIGIIDTKLQDKRMKRLRLQVQISVDGYIAGPKGEMDWMVWDWDDALKSYVEVLTLPVDTILLGRKMAGGFISHWANVANDPNHPEYDAGKKFVETPKVVFSKTLRESAWENTDIASGNLAVEINRLKRQNGKDMIVYGGASFVSALIKENLIDSFHLFINPVVLGDGLTIFKEINQNQNLRLVNSIPFDCGIVLLHYEPK
jgi:dihydrofolate reductase